MAPETTEVAVVGGGPAGLTAGLAIATAGIETVLVCRPPGADNRTTALLAGSVMALDTLGVWPRCKHESAPLRVLRLVDATARLLRAPEVSFHADEIGLDAFGHNIENRHLTAALPSRCREVAALRIVEDEARSIVCAEHEVCIGLKSGTQFTARLAVGSDGRRSLCRDSAAIGVDEWAYPQTALTFNLTHARPHDETSTEFHRESGPFTLVPLPGRRSSLVWVLDPDEARRVAQLDAASVAVEIERHAHSLLGKMTSEAEPGVFPLTGQRARRFAANRIALVGEAAHVLPPIGAQGLNLGLRDAATIAEVAVSARREGADVGSDAVLDRYDRARRADVRTRSMAVDLLNRSLLSDLLPVQSLRGFGLFMLDQIGPLRRAVMREGVMPHSGQPRLMAGEAL